MKTIVRMTVTLPENTATVQRLYDLGTTFKLDREQMTDIGKIERFISELKKAGGKEIYRTHYVSDDDFAPHFQITYEYNPN